MQEFQHNLLSHVNRYTRIAYKDDPAIVGILITNENDLTFHFGNNMMPNHHNPVHTAIFMKDCQRVCPANRSTRGPGTGAPGNRARASHFSMPWSTASIVP